MYMYMNNQVHRERKKKGRRRERKRKNNNLNGLEKYNVHSLYVLGKYVHNTVVIAVYEGLRGKVV